MTNSWKITDSDDTTITVDFTIKDQVYTQILLRYWEITDENGNKASGGIRTDKIEDAKADLNGYLADYIASIEAQQVITIADPLLGLTN